MFSGLGKEGDPPGGRDSSLECTSPLLSRYHRVAYRPARGPVPPHYSTVQTARVKRRLQGQFDTPQSVGSMPHAGPPSGIATPLTTRVPKIFAAEAEFLRWRLLCVSRRTSQKQEREERRQRYIRAAQFWIRTTLRRSWAAWKSHLRLALCIKRIRHRSAHAAWNAWVGLVTYKRDTQAKLAGAVAKMANRDLAAAWNQWAIEVQCVRLAYESAVLILSRWRGRHTVDSFSKWKRHVVWRFQQCAKLKIALNRLRNQNQTAAWLAWTSAISRKKTK